MYKKILVPVDGSTASQRGLAEAIKLAKALNASLRLVHIVDEFVMTVAYSPVPYEPNFNAALVKLGQSTLKKAEEAVIAQGLKPEVELIEMLGGRAADKIVEQAQRFGADLIVMGTHGRRGVRRLVMGSDAELVVRSAPAPVLLVRAPDES
jgi:nucleotide-binding universal stress UspA family protein